MRYTKNKDLAAVVGSTLGVYSKFKGPLRAASMGVKVMADSKARGNNPDLWDKLLFDLDEKLQLGLLDRLRRVAAYHFESETLFLDPATPEDAAYLTKGATFQQLELLAQDSAMVREVRVCGKGKFPSQT